MGLGRGQLGHLERDREYRPRTIRSPLPSTIFSLLALANMSRMPSGRNSEPGWGNPQKPKFHPVLFLYFKERFPWSDRFCHFSVTSTTSLLSRCLSQHPSMTLEQTPCHQFCLGISSLAGRCVVKEAFLCCLCGSTVCNSQVLEIT